MLTIYHRFRHLKPALLFFLASLGCNRAVFNEARRIARKADKPLLNAGCKSAYTKESDVNLDIIDRGVDRFVRGDIQNLHMFGDRQFAAVYVSHVLEHVDDPDQALSELHRVADNVFVITPLPLWPWAWIHPEHQWILWGTKKICRVPHFLRRNVEATKQFLQTLVRYLSEPVAQFSFLLPRTKNLQRPNRSRHSSYMDTGYSTEILTKSQDRSILKPQHVKRH